MSPLSRDSDRSKTTRDASDVAAKTSPRKRTRPLQSLKDNPQHTLSSEVTMHAVDRGDKANSSVEQQDISSQWIDMSTSRSLSDQPSSCLASQPNANPIIDVSFRNIDGKLDMYVPSNDTSSYQILDYESNYSNAFSTKTTSLHYSYPSKVTTNVYLDTLGIGSWVDDASLLKSARNMPPPQGGATSHAATLSIGSAGFKPFIEGIHGGGSIHPM